MRLISALNAVPLSILIRLDNVVDTKIASTAFVGQLFHGVMRAKVDGTGSPPSFAKALISLDTDVIAPNNPIVRTRMIAHIMAVAARVLFIAWRKMAMTGNSVGDANTSSIFVMLYRIVIM